MSKHMKATLTAIALLLASSVTAQEKPLAEATDKPLDADSVMSPWWKSFDFDFKQDDPPWWESFDFDFKQDDTPWWESFDFDFKQDDTPIDFDLSTHVEDCERAVFKLNIWSEAMDRAGGNAIKTTQQDRQPGNFLIMIQRKP